MAPNGRRIPSHTPSTGSGLAQWALLCAFVALAACGGKGRTDDSSTARLRVSAAASMTDVVEQLGAQFKGGKVSGNYGSSSDLARQIKDGAPADVYISASKKWADYMTAEGLADGEVLVFARNTLVCVVPADSKADVKDLPGLPGEGFKLVAVGDEGVPAGDYAREAFTKMGVADVLKPVLVGQKDVRAVLKAVAAGEVDCGFVYATDARTANVRILFTVEPSAHAPIEYYVCVVKSAVQHKAAKAFIDYLKSDTARGILREAGFLTDAD